MGIREVKFSNGGTIAEVNRSNSESLLLSHLLRCTPTNLTRKHATPRIRSIRTIHRLLVAPLHQFLDATCLLHRRKERCSQILASRLRSIMMEDRYRQLHYNITLNMFKTIE